MKKIWMAMMCGILLLGTASLGFADWGEWRGSIRERIQHAERRIDRGIERGQLTRHEAHRLNEELNHILNKIDRMKSDDGHLDMREREIIERDLDRLERDISREKHDDQYRGDGYRDGEYRRYR